MCTFFKEEKSLVYNIIAYLPCQTMSSIVHFVCIEINQKCSRAMKIVFKRNNARQWSIRIRYFFNKERLNTEIEIMFWLFNSFEQKVYRVPFPARSAFLYCNLRCILRNVINICYDWILTDAHEKIIDAIWKMYFW